jgi:hypothetical protein
MTEQERRRRFDDISEIGCCVCVREGLGRTPPEIHHLLTGRIPGRRNSDDQTIGLCPYHHRQGNIGEAIHAGKKSFERNHATELELLEWTENAISARRITTNLYA